MTDETTQHDDGDHPVSNGAKADDTMGDDTMADDARSTGRRARFRAALEAVSTGSSKDLIRWVMIPAAIAVVVGFNLMILGWLGAARTAREIEQIPYLISGGLIGLGILVVGALLLATAVWATVIARMSREAEERHREAMAAIHQRLDQVGAPRSNARPPTEDLEETRSASRN